jgi:hypothetical protein
MPREKIIDHDPGVATALAGLRQVDDEPPPPPVPPMVAAIGAETIDYIKAQMSEAVAAGIDEGTKRVVEKYHLEDVAKWGKAAVFAQFVTAAAAVGILMTLLLKDKD